MAVNRKLLRKPFCWMPIWSLYVVAILLIPVYLTVGVLQYGIPEAWQAFRSDWKGLSK